MPISVRISLFLFFLLINTLVYAAPIRILAAENFYAQVAQEIGGDRVQISSILNNPNQDPHLFTANPSIAILIKNADIIVYNGIGYDAWMERLIDALGSQRQSILIISALLGKKNGDNPHIWYDPTTMLIYAHTLCQQLIRKDPQNAGFYTQRLQKFTDNYQSLRTMIRNFKQKHLNLPVIATEPVFNYMANALGMRMYGSAFQISVMNGIEPSPRQIQAFIEAMRTQVKLLLYNQQVSSPLTQAMEQLARKNAIAISAVSETLPPHTSYLNWMKEQLIQIDQALHDNTH